MLAIEAHRSTIGNFYDTATSLLPTQYQNQLVRNIFSKRVMSLKKLQITSYCHLRKIVLFNGVTMFILFNVQQWLVYIKVIGDVENNPGPTYVVEKITLGSFYQGDRFGDVASIQCPYNLLYALCQKLKSFSMEWFQS